MHFDRSNNCPRKKKSMNGWMNESVCLEFHILPYVMDRIERCNEINKHIWFIASAVGIPTLFHFYLFLCPFSQVLHYVPYAGCVIVFFFFLRLNWSTTCLIEVVQSKQLYLCSGFSSIRNSWNNFWFYCRFRVSKGIKRSKWIRINKKKISQFEFF